MATALTQCTRPRCTYPIANDGAWHATEAKDCCARHRQLQRNADGRCPNCGGGMASEPIVNSLTGRPRTQAGSVPTMQRACTSCGYTLRPTRGRQ